MRAQQIPVILSCLLLALAGGATAQSATGSICAEDECLSSDDVPFILARHEPDAAPQGDGTGPTPTGDDGSTESVSDPSGPETVTPAPPASDPAGQDPPSTWDTATAWSADMPAYADYLLGAALTLLVGAQVALAAGPAWLLQVTRRLAWLTMIPVVFLFSRIRSSKVLDQPVRAQIMHIIQEQPGVDVDTLRRRSDVAWSTARHHLLHLERHDLVRSVRSGAHLIYFAADSPNVQSRQELSILQGRSRRRVAKAVLEHPGITNASIADRLGLSRPSVTHHLRPLLKAGLVVAKRQGREQELTAGVRLRDLLGPSAPTSRMAARSTMSFRPVAAPTSA